MTSHISLDICTPEDQMHKVSLFKSDLKLLGDRPSPLEFVKLDYSFI